MKKNITIIVLVLIILVAGAYLLGKNSKETKEVEESVLPQNVDTTVVKTPEQNVQVNNMVNKPTINPVTISTANWKTYTNTKYGFGFQYPETWSQWGKESEAVCNLKTGATCSTMLDFMDIISQGIERYDGNNNQIAVAKDQLHVEYHFDSKGATIYQYALSQSESKQGNYVNTKKIEVAGKTAIWADRFLTVNGKGKSIPPEFQTHQVEVIFLDKNNIGAFQFLFTTPKVNDSIEISNFEQLLKTFKFN